LKFTAHYFLLLLTVAKSKKNVLPDNFPNSTGERIMLDKIKINRNININLHKFMDYFQGFEHSPVTQKVFGENAKETLENLKVEFFSFRRGYMGVSEDDGHLIVSSYHLKNSDDKTLYLDVIHELVHVKQFMDGKQLFDERFEYHDRPTEIEAYQYTVEEARRIGMTDEEIMDYLRVWWMTDEDTKKLAERLGIKVGQDTS